MPRIEYTAATDLPDTITEEQARAIQGWVKLELNRAFKDTVARHVGRTVLDGAPATPLADQVNMTFEAHDEPVPSPT